MNRTVLVIDDDEPLRTTVCESLLDEGYVVIGAANGAEALERLRHMDAPPCMILLDLMMPVMNGWQFRDEQKRDPQLATIPVVVVTANTNVDGQSIDANAFIRKPLQLQTLLDAAFRFCPC